MAGAPLQRLQRLIPGTSRHTPCASPIGNGRGTGSPDAELISQSAGNARGGGRRIRGQGGEGVASRRACGPGGTEVGPKRGVGRDVSSSDEKRAHSAYLLHGHMGMGRWEQVTTQMSKVQGLPSLHSALV